MRDQSGVQRQKSLSQLQQLSKSIDISFKPDYADHVFEQTLQQSQSEAWRATTKETPRIARFAGKILMSL
jgi:predicted metalloenzyme YecM